MFVDNMLLRLDWIQSMSRLCSLRCGAWGLGPETGETDMETFFSVSNKLKAWPLTVKRQIRRNTRLQTGHRGHQQKSEDVA
jgi:hypothetical protein